MSTNAIETVDDFVDAFSVEDTFVALTAGVVVVVEVVVNATALELKVASSSWSSEMPSSTTS